MDIGIYCEKCGDPLMARASLGDYGREVHFIVSPCQVCMQPFETALQVSDEKRDILKGIAASLKKLAD